MDASELERLAKQAKQAAKTVGRTNPEAISLVNESARALSGFDPKLIPSVTSAFAGIDTTKLFDLTAVSNAASAFDFARPVVAPQVAEALMGIETRTAPSFSNAMKEIQKTSAFKFVNTIDFVYPTNEGITNVMKSLTTLNLPKAFTADMAKALSDLPKITPLNFAPRFEEAAENATALAEVEDVAEIIDAESVVAVGVLSPASKRVLASDVVALIAALLTFSACLFEGGYVQAGAAATAYAAIFVRIYWRLAGKLD